MRIRWLLIIPVTILSCANFLLAQEEATTKTDGKVVSVDVMANTIVVKTGEAKDTFSVRSGAKITLGIMELSKEITLNNLQADSRVTVTWKTIDGKKTATKIVQKSEADAEWKKGMP